MASIKEQLMRIAAKNVKTSSGKTIEQTLKDAVDYLYTCIQFEIEGMYQSYKPIRYKRRPYHDGLRSSLYAEDVVDARIVGNTIELSLKFNDNVWAWNVSYDHKSPVNYLMNFGWEWHDNTKPVERFTYYDGYHFIEKGIETFNRHNKWGVHIKWEELVDSSNWY